MPKVTLTTVVRNPATLPLLLKYTDELVEQFLLHSLRIVDCTMNVDQSTAVKSLLSSDGEKNCFIPNIDLGVIKSRDPRAVYLQSFEGYQHVSAGRSMTMGGGSVTVAVKGPDGAHIGLSFPERKQTNLEVVLNSNKCLIRQGRGGGNVIASGSMQTSLNNGKMWRTFQLVWDESGKFRVVNDIGEQVEVDMSGGSNFLDLTVSPPVKGVSDVLVSSLLLADMLRSDSLKRGYASYYKKEPPAAGGVDIISNSDIVFIELSGWESLVSGGIPLVIGDIGAMGALKRAGLLQRTEDARATHVSFLERSRNILQKVATLRSKNIPLVSNVESAVILSIGADKIGNPTLFSSLVGDLAFDQKLLKGYEDLLNIGAVGEDLSPRADETLSYLDSIVYDDLKCRDFLAELVEVLPESRRKYLLELLSKK